MSARRVWLIGAALAALAGQAMAQPGALIPLPGGSSAVSPSGRPLCAPVKLTRMVVRNISPTLSAAAPAAQPKLMYRQHSTLLRSEESPDPTRNAHNIVIIAEPQIWAMNMVTKTGQHQIDPGPELNVHAPILPVGGGVPPQFLEMEFGCEPDFIAKYAPQPRQVLAWGADRALMHVVVSGEHAVSILMHERRQAPLMIVYAKDNKPLFAIRYDEWRSDLPDRPTLFEPPKSVKFTEAAPSPNAPTGPPPTLSPTLN
jgi:hypothetical protein